MRARTSLGGSDLGNLGGWSLEGELERDLLWCLRMRAKKGRRAGGEDCLAGSLVDANSGSDFEGLSVDSSNSALVVSILDMLALAKVASSPSTETSVVSLDLASNSVLLSLESACCCFSCRFC